MIDRKPSPGSLRPAVERGTDRRELEVRTQPDGDRLGESDVWFGAVVEAGQCLEADGRSALELDDRLEDRVKLVLGQHVSQAGPRRRDFTTVCECGTGPRAQDIRIVDRRGEELRPIDERPPARVSRDADRQDPDKIVARIDRGTCREFGRGRGERRRQRVGPDAVDLLDPGTASRAGQDTTRQRRRDSVPAASHSRLSIVGRELLQLAAGTKLEDRDEMAFGPLRQLTDDRRGGLFGNGRHIDAAQGRHNAGTIAEIILDDVRPGLLFAEVGS